MGVARSDVRGVPYHVTYPMMHLMLHLHPCEEIAACENITSPQRYLRATKISLYASVCNKCCNYGTDETFIN